MRCARTWALSFSSHRAAEFCCGFMHKQARIDGSSLKALRFRIPIIGPLVVIPFNRSIRTGSLY